MKLSSEFLKLIRCPVSNEKLTYNQERNTLVSEAAKLEFPVKDGIPLLLKSEAKPIK